MAHRVLVDAYVSIGGTVLSDHATSVTINYSAETVDSTVMGLTSRARLPGLKDWSATIEFAQDDTPSEVSATLFAMVGTQVAVEFRPTSAIVGTSNPKYTGNGILESYPPISGSVGALNTASVTITGSDGVPLARATS